MVDCTYTPEIFPFSILILLIMVSKKKSHHKEIIFFLRFLTTHLSLSVPMWGLAEYKISSGAPQFTNSEKINLLLGSFTNV